MKGGLRWELTKADWKILKGATCVFSPLKSNRHNVTEFTVWKQHNSPFLESIACLNYAWLWSRLKPKYNHNMTAGEQYYIIKLEAKPKQTKNKYVLWNCSAPMSWIIQYWRSYNCCITTAILTLKRSLKILLTDQWTQWPTLFLQILYFPLLKCYYL